MNPLLHLSRTFGLCLLMAWAVGAHAQIPISDEGTVTGCGDALVDSGSSTGPYGANEDFTITLCPEAPDTTIWIEWSVFDLDVNAEIAVHNGNSTAFPILAQGTLDQLQNTIQVATEANPTGCLTIHFTSGAGSSGNFAAGINCGQPCALPMPVINTDDPAPFRVCPGTEVLYDGTDSYATGGGTIAHWQWDWEGDGVIDFEGDSGWASHAYTEPGIYRLQMHVVDDQGCESIELTNYIVQVSTDPVWTIDPLNYTSCTNNPVNLAVGVEGQTFTLEPSVDFGGGLFIPDEPGQCFSSDLTFTQFIPGQLVGDGNDALESFFINFEHSYMGDLTIRFICPNGQSVMVHQQGGGGTFLGVPVDNDGDPDTPGQGFDYWWSPDATNGTWAANLGGTLPSGTYESVQTWNNLDGCPLNGVWQMEICDLWGSDNGFVFDWAITFADSLYPQELSFTPTFGLACDSTFWTASELDQSSVALNGWDCANLTVTNPNSGVQTYTAHAVNNFGCEYTQDVTVEYVTFQPAINANPDIYCGGVPVELSAVVNMDGEGQAVYSWGPAEFLSDTVGSTVYAEGMEGPEYFVMQIAQTFEDYDGLVCTATADLLVGTCEIVIPNVISPFGTNGENDTFRIEGIQSYKDVELVIVNRWGNVVYESRDFGDDAPWDPAADNASSGVYYYVLTIPVEDGPLVVTNVDGVGVEYDGQGPFVFEGIFHVVD